MRVRGYGVNGAIAEALAGTVAMPPDRRIVITSLGLTQILAWGSTYYLPAVLAKPIAADTGWPLAWVVGGLSLGLLTAGIASPHIGKIIEGRGGRPVLATSAILLSVGLIGLAVAPTLPMYVGAWLVLGLGMGAGLYDAAFATLGRLYGDDARRAITTLTLFGGFASTTCWPLSSFLVSEVGWRSTCLIYAAIHLIVVLPTYLFALPRETSTVARQPPDVALQEERETPSIQDRTPREAKRLFVLLATCITLGTALSSVISVHLLTFLQARDVALASAVAFGALVGPSQVGARIVEMMFGRHHHPIWTMVASTVLVAAGIGTLWSGLPVIGVSLVLYGAGIGIMSIARGTVPLALFGAIGYASRMGRLAMPSLIAGAAAPSIGAMLIERFGVGSTLATLAVAAIINVVVVIALVALAARTKPADARHG